MRNLEECELTRLERDILSRFHERFADRGFPSAANLIVRRRWNTGAGRFTYLEHGGQVDLPDGELGLGPYNQIEMTELEAGASFEVKIKDAKVDYLEIMVNGPHAWDGTETDWVIYDPETGMPPD